MNGKQFQVPVFGHEFVCSTCIFYMGVIRSKKTVCTTYVSEASKFQLILKPILIGQIQ